MDALTLSEKTFVWPQVCEFLVEKFDILEGYDLMNYDQHLYKLVESLRQFRSKSFKHDQYIVFSLYDIDFYYLDSKIGFTVHNLVTILQSLDIELSKCILFTCHHGLKQQIQKFCRQRGSESSIVVCENDFCIINRRDPPSYAHSSAESLKFHFSFMCFTRKDHRSYTRMFLEKQGLQEKTLMHYHGAVVFPSATIQDKQTQLDDTIHLPMITTVPFVRTYDKIHPNKQLTDLYHNYHHVLDKKILYKDIEKTSNWYENVFNKTFLVQSFVNLVTETVFDFPYPYVTEKTFLCFTHRRPFVLIGSPGSLELLKSMGFQTFDQWWDESYDQTQNLTPADRLCQCFSIIEEISKWSLDQCRLVYNQMLPVLEHNDLHYRNHFGKTLLQSNIKELSKLI